MINDKLSGLLLGVGGVGFLLGVLFGISTGIRIAGG